MSKQLLIDGHYLAYRSFYAYPPNLKAANGDVVNVIFGFFTLLLKAIDIYKPSHLAVCFDLPGPTFRNEIYDQYKANRPPAPAELKEQVLKLKELLPNCGIPVITKEGYEADDVMGSLARLAESQHLSTYLLTGDQDSFQLISEHIKVLSPKHGSSEYKVYDESAVKEKLGVSPSQVIDFKALKGDSSDNIPGISGVGDKTAAKLITEYNNLENIYKNLDTVKPERIKNKLIDEKHKAFLSYELATIHDNLDLNCKPSELLIQVNTQALFTVFQEYKFESLLKRYKHLFADATEDKNNTASKNTENQDNIHYEIIESVEALSALIPSLKKGFAFDLETTALDVHSCQIVGLSLAVDQQQGYYIPMNSYLEDMSIESSLPMFTLKDTQVKQKQLTANPFLSALKEQLENKNIVKIAHNGKFDYQVLKRYGITVKGLNFDTMIAAFLLDPLQSVSLKELGQRHFNINQTEFKALFDDKEEKKFENLDINTAAKYAVNDAVITMKLYTLFKDSLKEKELEHLFYDIECPVQLVIAQMELNGVHIDIDETARLKKRFESDSDSYKASIYELAGETFNINSTQQLATILFDKLELPVIKKTKTGRSTDSSVLEKLADKHPIIEQLTQYRSNEKLLSTYINSIPNLINPSTGLVHSSFNQTVVPTGRLSSTNPNLQNIPIRTKKGLMIRNIFTSSQSDAVLLSADYSQIELRLMAHFSKDERMIQAFKEGADIHRSTAAIMFHCKEADITKEQRYQAKAVNFGIIYGISAYGLSQNINVPRKEAQAMIDHYFDTFPGIKAFIEETIQSAKEKGYVKTLYGRIRPLPFINSSDKKRAQFEERVSVNTILQGTAADIIKKAMITIHDKMLSEKLKSKLLIQVHDELLFEVPKTELEIMQVQVRKLMEKVDTFLVPLHVDISFANSWGDIE